MNQISPSFAPIEEINYYIIRKFVQKCCLTMVINF